MWTSFLYQHLVGGAIFLVAYLIYVRKAHPELKAHDGRLVFLYPLLAFGFYFGLTLAWQLLALGAA